MSAEDRRKAFAIRMNQFVGDHLRAGFKLHVVQRADLARRIMSALEDAYQMGNREGYERGSREGMEHVTRALDTVTKAIKP